MARRLSPLHLKAAESGIWTSHEKISKMKKKHSGKEQERKNGGKKKEKEERRKTGERGRERSGGEGDSKYRRRGRWEEEAGTVLGNVYPTLPAK